MSEGVPDRPSRGVITPCRLARARSSSTVARALLLLCALVCANTRATASEVVMRLAGNQSSGVAIGGDYTEIIDNGNGTYDAVHYFRTVSTNAVLSFAVVDASKIISGSGRFLAVGGGGCGGGDCGGGGGAGGFIYKTGLTLANGATEVWVGAGGMTAGAVDVSGMNGGDTKLTIGGTTYIAPGGGGGGTYNTNYKGGFNGGSGGGASGNSSDSPQGGASVQEVYGGAGRGNAGAACPVQAGGGGGGGAGGAADGQNGGAGVTCSITGTAQEYAAGGGGGGYSVGNAGGVTAGAGGGTGSSTSTSVKGYPAVDGSGSGGGGGAGGGSNDNRYGGAGGSGIVVIRYTFTNGDLAKYSILTPEEAVKRGGASGGDYVVRISGGTMVSYAHVFTNAGCNAALEFTSTSHPATGSAARYLAVAGGGAGGANNGGGGGAGGLLEGTISGGFARGDVVSVNVGRGGVCTSNNATRGNKGEDTLVKYGSTSIQAIGGGGGGAYNAQTGLAGGSGGGGSNGANAGGEGTTGQGNAGGSGIASGGTVTNPNVGAGGGGAGRAGYDATYPNDTTDIYADPGAGGYGKASDILGFTTYYAAGGGGGGETKRAAGGSASAALDVLLGGYGTFVETLSCTNANGSVRSIDLFPAGASTARGRYGMQGTGSGGGGARGTGKGTPGGNGGSGIVIIRYDVEEVAAGDLVSVVEQAEVSKLGGALGGDYINKVINADGTISFAHVYTNTSAVGSFQFTNPSAIVDGSAHFLAVGGGGAGGAGHYNGSAGQGSGGGGGAGGMVTNSLEITGEEYQIIVGAGGAGQTNSYGQDGYPTTITNITSGAEIAWALGGGGGGDNNVRKGRNGGSGGGGCRDNGGGSGLQGTTGYPDGLGHDASSNSAGGNWIAGGGGGAGSAGKKPNSATQYIGWIDGGDAVASSITGYSVMYAGGGGGGTGTGFVMLSSGGGTGGRGGIYSLGILPTSGQDGTGSGGGGGGGELGGPRAGGSGIVVIRYTVRGARAKEMDDGSTLYTFEDEEETLIKIDHPSLVRILAVGGGGAGASGLATTDQAGNGGGGAGGFIETNLVLNAGTYSVRIGAGGKPHELIDVPHAGGNGKDTVISNVTESAETEILRAYGGGGGAAHNEAAGSGGSGGGGNHTSVPGVAVDNGYGIQGKAGGEVHFLALSGNGAGGGGAGSVGDGVFSQVSNLGGDGGDGKISDINGTEIYYAAGGGGGSMMGTGGAGGSDGVGGAGGGMGVRAQSGAPGTGGGGGGGGGTTPYGGSGGSGIAYFRVMREMPVKPQTLFTTNYTGEVHTFYKMAEGDEYIYTITPDGSSTTTNEIAGINAGTNLYNIALMPGACWYDGSTDSVTVTQVIERAEVTISYEQPGWQVGGIVPDCTVETDPAEFADLVIREWYDSSSSTWINWTNDVPSAAGTWLARAYIEDTENYYCAATQEINVLIWEYDTSKTYPDYLGYHSDITFSASDTNRFVLVRINDGMPEGFTYNQALDDGSDIRFSYSAADPVDMTKTNAVLLAYVWDVNHPWNKTAESWAWVSVPVGISEIAMSWGVIVDDEGKAVEIPGSPEQEESLLPTDGSINEYRLCHSLVKIVGVGTSSVSNYPMALLIKTNSPVGFNYDNTLANGADLVFTGNDGTLLPYEVETWDPDGESLVWVKVPNYAEGETFNMHWGYLADIDIPNATNVWSNYVGVWHMGSGNDAMAGTYGTDATYDSTGKNNSNTVLGSVSVSTNGVFGSGLGATVQGEPLLLVTASDNLNSITSAAFTVSFWTKFNATGTGTSVQYLFSRRPRYDKAGYAALINENRRVVDEASNTMRILFGEAWGSGGNFTASKFGFKTEEWIRHDVYFRGATTSGRFEWWINGVYIDGVSWNNSLVSNGTTGLFGIGGLAATGSDSNINGSMDEFRISSGAPSASQIAAETNMWARISSGEGVVDYGTTAVVPTNVLPAVITPGSIFQNRWVVEPVINPETWTLGESPTITAQPAYGTYSYTFTGDSGSFTNALPTTNGSYNATFTVPAAATNELSTWGYSALEYHYKNALVVDRENEGHHTIGGEWGPTMSGRVLLVNDEPNLGEPVKGQSYWQTNELSEVGTYWVHGGEVAFVGTPNLHEACNHTLYATTNVTELCDTNIIWSIHNARIGNLYTSAHREQEGYVYLPFSPTAKVLKEGGADGEYEDFSGIKASHNIVLRNTDEAEIISPCYTNGIGTIYFDAVNSYQYNGDYTYHLQVEISTNEYIRLEVVTNIVEEVETVVTNEVMEYNWQPLTITPFRCVNKTFTKYSDTTTLSLEIGVSSAQNIFYRAVVPVYNQLGEYRGPARFRIKRVDSVDSEDAIDGLNQILIDNIVVSYPADGIRLGPVNEEHFDTLKTGFTTLGVEYAAEKPYPVVGDSLKLRARAEFLLSPVDTNVAANVDASQYISSTRTFYRWRYLSQHIDDWSTVPLSYTDLGTTNIMPATAATGVFKRQGDVEFFYETRLTAPYYTLYDYTGGDRQIPVSYYTENISVVTNRYSASKDWFIRLREGESNLSEMHIIATDGTTVTTNNMELIGDDAWQGFHQTLTNTADKISFVVEMVNRQQEGAEWSFNTNWYKFSSSSYYGTTPATDTLSEMSDGELADVTKWSSVTNTGTTGYLMFRVTDLEKGKSISIVRADMQNFNFWSDARQTYYVGYGEPTATNAPAGASGTAAGKKLYSLLEDKTAGPLSSHQNFAKWSAMENTHTNWIQWIDAPTTTQRTRNEWNESDTWEAWNYGEMMWIGTQYLQNSDTSALVQLAGDGRGWMQYNNVASIPRGIEKVEYSARVMQSITYDSFAYWNKGLFMTNYTFVVSAKMIDGQTDDFTGDGSVSVVANYTPLVGGYEFRVVRAAKNNLALQLYKWEGKTATQLGSQIFSNLADNTRTAAGGNETGLLCTNATEFARMKISVSNGTDRVIVRASLQRYHEYGSDYAHSDANNCNWVSVQYTDENDPFTSGTFGVGSASCHAVFYMPRYYPDIMIPDFALSGSGNFRYSNSSYNVDGLPSDNRKDCFNSSYSTSTRWKEWSYDKTRWTTNVVSSATTSGKYYFGFKARIDPQNLIFETQDSGSKEWVVRATNTVDSLNSSTINSVNLYATADTILRIKTGGKKNEGTPDVAIGNVQMYQWRGGSWNDTGDTSPRKHITGYVAEDAYNYTNITFMSAWITTNSAERAILLSAKRANPSTVSGIKTPLMYDSATYGGAGIGMLSYRYSSAQTNTVLLVQIATNDIGRTTWTTEGNGNNTNIWRTVETHTFSEADLNGGIRSVYFGIHGLVSAARIIVSPDSINAVSNVMDKTAFGDIYITDFRCTDEPNIDKTSWWGWNIRSVGNDAESGIYDPEGRMYLCDVSDSSSGMSMSLNNSITYDINPNESYEVYKEHMPFVQTPELGGSLGEIRFKARNYAWKGDGSTCDTNETAAANFNSTNATISLYGASNSNAGKWEHIKTWMITNDIFTVYSYKASANNYKAFRLVANDVKLGGDDPSLDDGGYKGYEPVRFLIDEVVVAEGIKPIVLFRNVGAFRGTNTEDHVMTDYAKHVPNVPSRGEQPLCDEPWGIQCEIYAAQLADEIDINLEDPPKVYLHYYPSTYQYSGNWGYANWREKNEANTIELKLTEDSTLTNLFYRSSFVDGESHLPIIANSAAPTTVQYILEVIYKQGSGEHAGSEITNVLDASQWTMPEWYAGADYNAQLGGNREDNFSAYAILDTVAPGWAWFNEVNVVGQIVSAKNTEAGKQFIEIAVPEEVDINGWKVYMYGVNTKNTTTNRIAYFTRTGTLKSTKSYKDNNENGMTFRVVAPPDSTLSTADGSLDGTWDSLSAASGALMIGGAINPRRAFGLQLVRKSGIIEDEIVAIGTNQWKESVSTYDPEYVRDALNERMHSGNENFIYIGADDSWIDGKSLSIFDEKAETAEVWTNLWQWTPGKINSDGAGNKQKIGEHPTPNGETLIVTCRLSTTNLGARLWHKINGTSDWTNETMQVYTVKGDPAGLTIDYMADPWFELGSVTTNGAEIAFTETGARLYQATVAQNMSNSFTVVAAPKLSDNVKIDDSRYHDAIVDWLTKGERLDGTPFKHPDSNEIYEVQFFRPGGTLTPPPGSDEETTNTFLNTHLITNLNLRLMYWLDLDPTDGPDADWPELKVNNVKMYGGLAGFSMTNRVRTIGGVSTTYHNIIITPNIWFTNVTGGAAWPPYVLRGATPGEVSTDTSTWSGRSWSSANFKITGRILNGLTSSDNSYNWVPLRYFTFKDGSFDPVNFTSKIEIDDVYSPRSLGYEHWKASFEASEAAGRSKDVIGLFWMIDDRIAPVEVEPLKPENYYGNE